MRTTAIDSSIFYFITLAYPSTLFFFFLNDTPPPEIYPLPPHDALPIPGGVCAIDTIKPTEHWNIWGAVLYARSAVNPHKNTPNIPATTAQPVSQNYRVDEMPSYR